MSKCWDPINAKENFGLKWNARKYMRYRYVRTSFDGINERPFFGVHVEAPDCERNAWMEPGHFVGMRRKISS
jgi:hypothetical protein